MAEKPGESKEQGDTGAAKKRARPRSPNYPGIDLERALGLAQIIHKEEKAQEAPVEAIWHDWRMKPRSGPALQYVAALKSFGLLDGSRGKVRLSALALEIIIDQREDATERNARLRQAALKPASHAELWEKYQGKLPSDATMKYYLMQERGFTDRGAEELIQQFRRTISFARLGESNLQSPAKGDKLEAEEGTDLNAHTSPETKPPVTPILPAPGVPVAPTQDIQFFAGPLSATIRAPRPLTKGLWDQMMKILEAMEPTVVEPKVVEPKKES